MNKLKKNDTVVVTAGKDKGKQGSIRRMLLKDERAVVVGINMVKRHQRPRNMQQVGGIIDMEAPIHISNLMLLCPNCAQAARVGVRLHADGVRRRFCKKCNEDID